MCSFTVCNEVLLELLPSNEQVRLVIRHAHNQTMSDCKLLNGCCHGLQPTTAICIASISSTGELSQFHLKAKFTIGEKPELPVTPWCKAEVPAQLLCRVNRDASHCCATEMPEAQQLDACSAQPESAKADRKTCDLRHSICGLTERPAAAQNEGNSFAFELQHGDRCRCQWPRPAATDAKS